MRFKLVAFDMDGTLITNDSCWAVIHDHFGTREAARHNLAAYERGEIDYPDFMRRDIALWRPVPTVKEIRAILSSYELAPNAREVVDEVHKRRYKTAIITGGLDLLADEVAKDLCINNVFSNGLAVDERGYLTGEGIFAVDPRQKDRSLRKLTEMLGVKVEDCVAVGDSKYDAKFLNEAGFGVAVGLDSELARVADVVIKDFDHFFQLLEYL